MLHLALDVNSAIPYVGIFSTRLNREISLPILSRQQVGQGDLANDEPRVDTLYGAILDLASMAAAVGMAAVHVGEV